MMQVQKIPFVKIERAPDPSPLLEKKVFSDGESTLPYRIHLPRELSPEKRYPLVLFFHGAGERGSDNEKQLLIAIGQFFGDPASPLHDCIVIAPQCPEDSKWVPLSSWEDTQYSTDELPESLPLSLAVKLIEEAKRTYPIDPDRVYSTGLSMGGYATWDLLVRHTDLFAAAIPVCATRR
jgi:predicted peptidase